jgi:hypothetical protein
MEILNYEEQPKGSFNISIFTVYLPNAHLSIHKVRLNRSKKGHLFISLPAFGIDQPDGSRKWQPYIEWFQEKGKEFNEKVLEALKPFLK